MEIKNFNENIDLSTVESCDKAAKSLLDIIKPHINKIIASILQGTFDYTKFTFARTVGSGLTNMGGLYLVINKATKKFYLGGASNLAQRKGEHKAALKNPKKPKVKLSYTFKEEVFLGNSDFYFVPLLIFKADTVIVNTANKSTKNQQIAQFLDQYVEKPLLEGYLSSNLQSNFLNVKTVGRFEIGNTFGGAPNSGQPNKAVFYGNYAWESITAAALTFNVAPRSIRFSIEKNKIQRLTEEEFNLFPYVKISKDEAKTYFQKNNKIQELNKLLSELFPNKPLFLL